MKDTGFEQEMLQILRTLKGVVSHKAILSTYNISMFQLSRFVFFILIILCSACQKQKLDLAEVPAAKDKIEYTQELKLNDKK